MLIDELINLSEIIAKYADLYQKLYDSKGSVRFRFDTKEKVYINYDKLGRSKNSKRIIRRGWITYGLDYLELSLFDNEHNIITIHVFNDTSSKLLENTSQLVKVHNKNLYNNLLSILTDKRTGNKKK